MYSTLCMQARGIIERLPHIELDSLLAEDGVPLIEECNNLLCDTRTLAIWGATAFCLMLVSFCMCWNCYIHWKADRETDVPAFLQNIREQQAKYKRMNLKVRPSTVFDFVAWSTSSVLIPSCWLIQLLGVSFVLLPPACFLLLPV